LLFSCDGVKRQNIMRVGISEYHIKYCWPGKDPQLLRVHMSGKESSERLKEKPRQKRVFEHFALLRRRMRSVHFRADFSDCFVLFSRF